MAITHVLLAEPDRCCGDQLFYVTRSPLLADFVAKVGYDRWMLVGRFTIGGGLSGS
jgi:hypothetical protein